jgi:hypothetical protein
MTVGAQITAERYNLIQNKVATVLGQGTGDSGYGQTVVSSNVAVSQLIEDNHLNDLRLDIRKAHIHQTGSYPTLGTVNNTVTVDDNNSGAGTGYVQFETLADTITTNRNTSNAGRFAINSTSSTYTRTPVWNGLRTGTFTVTFASVNAKRYYFNTGSAVQISMNISGSVASKVTEWNALFSGMGTLSFSNSSTKTGASGTLNSINALNLTTADQTIYTSSNPLAPYAANYFTVSAKFTDISEMAIQFTINLRDDAAGNVDEDVDGSLTITVSDKRPDSALTDGLTIVAPAFGSMGSNITTA